MLCFVCKVKKGGGLVSCYPCWHFIEMRCKVWFFIITHFSTTRCWLETKAEYLLLLTFRTGCSTPAPRPLLPALSHPIALHGVQLAFTFAYFVSSWHGVTLELGTRNINRLTSSEWVSESCRMQVSFPIALLYWGPREKSSLCLF